MTSTTGPRRAETLCGVELGDPEATAIAVANLAEYKALGFRVRRDWDSRGPYGDDCGLRFHFLDHLYRIGRGRSNVYVAEPYGVSADDLVELARLIGVGWEVWIGETPLWYPGRTTPILMQRRTR